MSGAGVKMGRIPKVQKEQALQLHEATPSSLSSLLDHQQQQQHHQQDEAGEMRDSVVNGLTSSPLRDSSSVTDSSVIPTQLAGTHPNTNNNWVCLLSFSLFVRNEIVS